MDREALIFLHVPKTAGTTLNRIIEWQYNPLSIFTIDPHRIRATGTRFKTFSEDRRRRFRVVRGHLPYGIHEYLPQGAVYITILREPVARLFSSYNSILDSPLHSLHRKFKSEHLGIQDLIALQPHRCNAQCRMISGLGKVGTCDERTLETAKENLVRSFGVVGLSERFQESLLLMMAFFGWKVPFYENYNVSKTRPSPDPRLVEMLSEHNRLDIELYEFGKKLFEESLRKNEDVIRKTRISLSAIPRPGSLQGFCHATFGVGRFLLSKAVSAI